MNKSIAFSLLFLCGCSASRVPDIKAHAKETVESAGFKIVGYQGYQWGGISSGTYGGRVWYQVERKGKLYELAITKWGNEYHIYNLKCLEAISSDR